MKKTLLMVLLGIFVFGSMAFAGSTDVRISVPMNGDGCIPKDTPFEMEVWIHNDYGTMSGLSMPFILFSDDGSITNVTHVDVGGTSAVYSYLGTSHNDASISEYNSWDSWWSFLYFWYAPSAESWDGVLPDSVNNTGACVACWGTTTEMVHYFGFNLQIADDGRICIDSVEFADPAYNWLFDDPDLKMGGDTTICFCVGTLSDVNTLTNPMGIPTEFDLGQNYPNPFNMSTVINFAVPTKADVTVTVFNILGQKVNTIFDGEREAGYHEAVWDGTSDNGTEVSSGMYFYKIESGSYSDTKKLVLLK